MKADGIDVDTPVNNIAAIAKDYAGVIVATPTDTHFDILVKLSDIKNDINILCEKPLTKGAFELAKICQLYKDKNLQMVMQYKDLDLGGEGDSFYDYYNHGRDGLHWDCLQIVGLARGRVMLSEDSPYWKCRLNGADLDIKKMDYAYSMMLRRWFRNPKGDLGFLTSIHDKVRDMIDETSRAAEAGSDRYTSAFY
jgi:hypothetical protein